MNNSTRKCKKDYCEKVFLKNQQSFSDKLSKKLKMKSMKFTEKQKKEMLKHCFKAYCNPTCKETIFQNGKEFPKNINIPIKNKKVKMLTEKFIKETRKKIFGKKTSVLKDSFYKKLNSKTVKNLKQKSALSGCTIAVFK
jgi:hypothetical protein